LMLAIVLGHTVLCLEIAGESGGTI
jgi:hypothetical protein